MTKNNERKWDGSWRTRASWFFSEFVVVVAGVLVALALNAWWQAQQNRSFELQYLEQLNRDIENTISAIESHTAADFTSDRALSMLVRAFRMNPPPPRDSLVAWSISAPNVLITVPIVGTAETIVSSGDLRLIRNDSLRLAMPTFVESSHGFRENMQRFGNQFVEGAREMMSIVDFYGLIQEVVPASTIDSVAASNPMFSLPENATRRSVTNDISGILNRSEAYDVFSFMHTAQRNMTATRQAMLAHYQEMHARVRKALEE